MNRKKIISPETDRNIVDDCPPLNEEEAIASTEENVLPVPSPTAKPYYAGIDIIKILAVFMVVSVHTYLHDGMYDVPIDSTKYILPLVLRWIAYTCVPLFMISTGYLMKNKKFSGKYYLGIIKILVIYIVASILCMICKHKIYGVDYSDHWMTLKGFLECYNADYAWYINYYVSIFMFIPFLNSAFDGMKTKGKRFALVATFVIFTIFSKSLFLGFDRTRQIRLFPDYLSGAWSVAYYFTGAFIREYPLKRCLKNKLLIVLGLIASTAFLTWSTYNRLPMWNTDSVLCHIISMNTVLILYILWQRLFLCSFVTLRRKTRLLNLFCDRLAVQHWQLIWFRMCLTLSITVYSIQNILLYMTDGHTLLK